MARKVHKRKPKPTAQVKISWGQLRFPGEVQHYWLAVLALIWGCLLIAGTGWYVTKAWQWAYLGLWPIGSLLLVNYLSDRPRRQQLKQVGPTAWVRPNNHAPLYRQLVEVCSKLGVRKAPRMALVEDEAPYIYSMAGGNGTIVLTNALVALLRPEELAVLLGREVAHVKFGHLRLERALNYIHTVSPTVALAFAPVWLWSALMGEWQDVVDYTCDRAALLVAGDPALVNATIVKAIAAADPQSALTPEDVDTFLNLPKNDNLDGAVMERRFNLSRFIESQPNLRDRIEQVAEFYQSEEGQGLLQKLAEMKAGPAAAKG
jgi:Zn-dependent protease with chaperone function